jgi:hypothetical protein
MYVLFNYYAISGAKDNHNTRIFSQNSKKRNINDNCATSRNPLFSCGIFVFWPIKEIIDTILHQQRSVATWRRPRSPSKYINEQRPFRATPLCHYSSTTIALIILSILGDVLVTLLIFSFPRKEFTTNLLPCPPLQPPSSSFFPCLFWER